MQTIPIASCIQRKYRPSGIGCVVTVMHPPKARFCCVMCERCRLAILVCDMPACKPFFRPTDNLGRNVARRRSARCRYAQPKNNPGRPGLFVGERLIETAT